MSAFFERIALSQDAHNTLLCIGLDPDPKKFPEPISRSADPIFEFNKAIVDATSDLVCCYKPQIAHYAAAGAESALAKTIDYIHSRKLPVLLDAKRGDVGSTAEMYAIELFERYQADAITINPYLGADAMAPYLEYTDKGIFILCRTSNPGGADLQNLVLENGKQLYEHVAQQAATAWNRHGNVGLVVGATQPSELARIRELVGAMTLLVPGVGAQGGDIASTVAAGQGGGMLVSSSRAILYASSGMDFAERARTIAIATRDKINAFRAAA